MDKNESFFRGLLTGLCSALVILLVVFGVRYVTNNSSSGNDIKIETDTANTKYIVKDDAVIEKTEVLQALIDQYYLNDVKNEDIIEGMYKGILEGLKDPYSVYYTKEEYASMMESTSGKYCGIGVTVSQDVDSGVITVVKPFENSPGYIAGLLPGDIIFSIDGQEVTGEELSKVVARIKGEEGTTVDIKVLREGETDYLDYVIERKEIEVPTIAYKMLANNVGYIQIAEFDEVTDTQFKTALTDLTSQGMKGLVIDLRDNPGGRLDIVCNMLDLILPEGIIVYTEDKNGTREEEKSDANDILNVPLSVLINGNSASASEIFAGAVKDYKIGTLVGTTSFGKGIVQRLYPLEDGTAVKLTISKYYTPNGNNIHGIGIKPDVEIDLTDELKQKAIITMDEDNQLQKAIEVLNIK